MSAEDQKSKKNDPSEQKQERGGDLPAGSGDAFALSDPEKSGASLTELMHAGMGIPSPFMKDIYLLRQAIVGTRYLGGSDELVEDLKPGSRISFVAEPDNKYDEHAVMALDSRGRKLGYIPRHENGIIGALLKAGKSIYGIMPDEQPEYRAIAPGSEKTPYSIWVDLYMREFLLPDDMAQIPRQGYQGSYAVADFILWDDEEGLISSIYVIKVINGEEKDNFRRMIDREDPESYREAIDAFRKFVGYLPIVSHDITEEVLPQLEDAYGVQLGLPFSNRVIDTLQMAANHLPWVRDASLENLAEELGIEVNCDTPEEKRCRITWKLYVRMERSELKKSPDIIASDAKKTQPVISRLDLSIEEYPMSEHVRTVLRANQILTLRELSRYSREEADAFRYYDDRLPEAFTKLLAAAGGAFRPDGTDRTLYGYPEKIQRTALKKESVWEYRLLFGAIVTYYEWLQSVREVPVYFWQTQDEHGMVNDDQEMVSFLRVKIEDIKEFVDDFSQVMNKQLQEAVGTPGEPGNVEAIMKTVEDLMGLYKRIMIWERSYQFICTENKYRKVIERFAGIAGDLYASFDDLYKRCVSAVGQLEAFLAGELDAEQLTINMNIKVNFDSAKALEALQEFM